MRSSWKNSWKDGVTMPKTKARMMAEEMESDQAEPISKLIRQIQNVKVDPEGGMGPVRRAVQKGVGALGPAVQGIESMMRRPRRDEDEMSELTREVGRSMNYKKGGKVKSSASKRGDGIAQRGKTRGKFV